MRRGLLYFCMILISMIFMNLVEPLDRLISEWLRLHSLPVFADIMDRSIFEGEGLGAGDFAIFLQVAGLLLWLGSFLSVAPQQLRRWRAALGYILATSILTALWVHLFKGVVARPRPYELATSVNSWDGWNERLLQGWGRGSFPSGHTANAISLLTFCYASYAMGFKKLPWIGGILVMLLTFGMAVS
ncbi:MAG: phosphatase PAP2 family protein, partial [Pseudobdellovibrionaceae bacterium]|nr:phosphatase PAP2 family protein [Pseudobdellovibrionaceae bacterium]